MLFTFFVSFTFPVAAFTFDGITTIELLQILNEYQVTVSQCNIIMQTIQSGGVVDPEHLEQLLMKMVEYKEALGLDFDEPLNLRTIGHFKATNTLNISRIARELVQRGEFVN